MFQEVPGDPRLRLVGFADPWPRGLWIEVAPV